MRTFRSGITFPVLFAMTPRQALVVALEAAVGVLLLLYATFLASNRRERSKASLLLAGLCAAIAVMMGANLLLQMLGWQVFADLTLFVDLLTPPLVLGLVQQAARPPPPLRKLDLAHLTPAIVGLTVWKAGLVSSMDLYVIGCWSLYLAWASRSFARRRDAYGSADARRLLAAVLGFSGLVLALRGLLAFQATANGSFLRAGAYLAVLGVCLVAACLILFAALGRVRLLAAWPAPLPHDAQLAGLEDRLQAALGARIFLDPNLSLNGLATTLGAPSRLVSRLINERYGLNVAAFLNRCRVEAAAQRLLAEPDLPIKTVMYDSGFVSKSIFNAEFQRRMGASPTAYRRQGADARRT